MIKKPLLKVHAHFPVSTSVAGFSGSKVVNVVIEIDSCVVRSVFFAVTSKAITDKRCLLIRIFLVYQIREFYPCFKQEAREIRSCLSAV